MCASIPTITALATTNPDGFIKAKKTVFAGIVAERLRLLQQRAAMLKGSPPKPYLREPVPDVVLVGSSITFRLKEEYFATRGLRNLALAGGSPVTGW